MQKDSPDIIPYKCATRIAKALKILFILYFICVVLSIIFEWQTINFYSIKIITQLLHPDADVLQIYQLSYYVQILRITVFVITVISYSLWIYRIYQNMSYLGASYYLRMTPGWAVGWYFIPIANLFKPYQGMKDVWNACDTKYNNEKGIPLGGQFCCYPF